MSAKLTPTEQVLRASLLVPNPFDIKFFLFSKRSTVGKTQDQWITRVGEPRAVFAASAILNQIDYFRGSECVCFLRMRLGSNRVVLVVLSNGFSESQEGVSSDAQFPDDQSPYTEEFEYESDSDLEDDVDIPASDIHVDHSSGPATTVEVQEVVADQKGSDKSVWMSHTSD